MSLAFHKFHEGPIIRLRWTTQTDLQSRVAVGVGARQHLVECLAQLKVGKRVLLLYPSALAATWGEEIEKLLDQSDYQVSVLQMPDGEIGKSLECLSEIWDTLQLHCLDRTDTIVALGGGALTDLAGFAASTYLRGINLVLLPTTLLAQVDAAIGGKTGINLISGKNLAGTIYTPQAVIVDPAYLSTLPTRDFTSGLAEVIKYALLENTIAGASEYKIGPRRFFDILSESLPNINEEDSVEHIHPLLPGIITSCIKMKLATVAADLREANLRRCLNLGHTLGHALEKVSDYKLAHGEAVAIGLVFATRLAVKKNLIGEEALNRLTTLLEDVSLPLEIPGEYDKQAISQSMLHDKKRAGEKIKLILPKGEIGSVDYSYEIPTSEIAHCL
jgi:3-dehydroquinate synthase